MRKIFLIFSTAFLIFSCNLRAQDCNIGNEDTAGYDNLSIPFWANYLLGSSFNLSAAGTLQSMNLISFTAGAQVQMAVYDDNSGAPGNLIAASSVGVVAQGVNTLPVTPLLLNPGDYWIMAIYSADEYGICNNSTGNNSIYYTSLVFGNPFPSTAAGFTNYIGADIAYFLEIACLSTGEKAMDGKENIQVYPNPSNGYFYIYAPTGGKEFTITDTFGRLVREGTVQNNQPVSTKSLRSGIYFVNVLEKRKKLYSEKVVVY